MFEDHSFFPASHLVLIGRSPQSGWALSGGFLYARAVPVGCLLLSILQLPLVHLEGF